MGTKILVVDDDRNICELLKLYLENDGYTVFVANDGQEAVEMFQSKAPELVLLDIMLPKMDGWQVCREIRKTSNTPIIMLTAKGETFDKVLGLELGADDYVTKPFNTKELLARIAVHLRTFDTLGKSEVLSFEEISLDTNTHIVSVKGEEIKLTRTEYAILKILLQNQTQVVAKSQLLDRISEDTPDCTESSLKTHISNLRKKLRDAGGKDYIEAIWGIGFKLKTE